jgi:hypothetical protein
MYLTAHHVRNQAGETGINAYFNHHEPRMIPDNAWDDPDVVKIADQEPGRILAQSVEIKPGGNTVLSHLDVVAPEETSREFLADALRLFEHYVQEDSFPVVWSTRKVGVRFGITLGLRSLASAEYRRLRSRILLLLGITSQNKVRIAATKLVGPVRILVEKVPSGETYELDPESTSRISGIRPELRQHTRIRISEETKSDFKAYVGEVYPHVAMSLTGLTQAQLAAIGGAEVIEVENDRVVWRIQGNEPAAGFRSPEIPGQIIGVWVGPNDPMPGPDSASTGAILPRIGVQLDANEILALHLVKVEDVWLPLSDAAIRTYSHSSGLAGTEYWRFFTKPVSRLGVLTFAATYDQSRISVEEVEHFYGRDAAARARIDRKTLQLRLSRENC